MVSVPSDVRKAAQRPGAKEGGREEEEKRSGVATSDAGRLRSGEPMFPPWTARPQRSSTARLATGCEERIGPWVGVELISSKYNSTVQILRDVPRAVKVTAGGGGLQRVRGPRGLCVLVQIK
jgi:hypothetical protein